MIEMRKKISVNKFLGLNKKTIAVVVAFVVLAGSAGYFGWQFYVLKNDTEAQNKALAADVKSQVSKIYAVPEGEEPTVARIENKDSLADQVFFAKAQNGDYVLVYEKSKLALLYRQQDGKLINAGPISTESDDDITNKTTTSKTSEENAQKK
ncbi:MAG: hypothetical protein PVI21_02395 [Candidatus Woesebacteria bacterium]|jgi:hypothetical protein